MEPFSFDKLPEVIRHLFERIERLELGVQNLQSQEKDEDSYLTIKEAANFLNTTIPALYSMVARREIPVNKPGKRLYFNKAELIEWLRSGRKKTMVEIQDMAKARLKKGKKSFYY